MIDLTNVTSAADVFTVWLREDLTVGGVAFAPNLPVSLIPQVSDQVVPQGRPYVIMLRANVPDDYETSVDFIVDWETPDGFGGVE